jgi:hypothetical protein
VSCPDACGLSRASPEHSISCFFSSMPFFAFVFAPGSLGPTTRMNTKSHNNRLGDQFRLRFFLNAVGVGHSGDRRLVQTLRREKNKAPSLTPLRVWTLKCRRIIVRPRLVDTPRVQPAPEPLRTLRSSIETCERCLLSSSSCDVFFLFAGLGKDKNTRKVQRPFSCFFVAFSSFLLPSVATRPCT